MARPIITLTTDYGTNDHLVGVLKGVILNINPEVNIVDITHSVLAHDVLDGALTISQAYKYFPAKTIHVVVVDPGVGTARRPILVAGDTHYFVAPDNGVLSAIYDKSESLYVWNITVRTLFQAAGEQYFSWPRHFCAGSRMAFEILGHGELWRRNHRLRSLCYSQAKNIWDHGERNRPAHG